MDGDKPRAAALALLRMANAYFSPALRDSLFKAIPGADAVAAYGTEIAVPSSGIEAMMSDAMKNVLGIKDPLVSTLTELKAVGLDSSQALSAGRIFLNFVRDQAGIEIVKQMASEIPGLSRLS